MTTLITGELVLTPIRFARVALRFALIASLLSSEEFQNQESRDFRLKGTDISCPFYFSNCAVSSVGANVIVAERYNRSSHDQLNPGAWQFCGEVLRTRDAENQQSAIDDVWDLVRFGPAPYRRNEVFSASVQQFTENSTAPRLHHMRASLFPCAL